jgi:hypothetical protein
MKTKLKRFCKTKMYKVRENRDKEKGHTPHIQLVFMISLAIICFVLLFTGVGVASASNTYYASPSGGGDGSSPTSPFQIADFWAVTTPGDTLILLDGTYTGSRSMIYVGDSGTESSPITIKALNDGQAIIDGENSRTPIQVYHHDYIILEGLRAQNSDETVISISGTGHVLRRVSAYNANPNSNSHIFTISMASNILVEDCAASGTGRNCFLTWRSDNVILRRCWGKWVQHTYAGPRDWSQIYGGSNCLYENCVGYLNPESSDNYLEACLSIVDSYAEYPADDNTIYGCVFADGPQDTYYGALANVVSSVVVQLKRNHFKDVVNINCHKNFALNNDIDCQVNHMTCIDGDYSFQVIQKSGYVAHTTLKNSVLASSKSGSYGIYKGSGASLTHEYNDIYNHATQFSGTTKHPTELEINPGYSTAKYGRGAYLMRAPALKGRGENGADMGAEVLYQYENGALTDKRLWPWPMEDRIFEETGVSVTWEAKGGLWKTLDGVYEADVTGTISGTVTDKDTGNPIEGATVTANGYSDPDGADSNGYYEILNVPVGIYTIEVSATGYHAQSRTNVQVLDGQTTTVDFQLTPQGEVSPSVTDIKFTELGQSQEITSLEKDKWYDLYIYVDDPQGGEDIAFADLWFNSPSYTEGTIDNRGGDHYAASSYIWSYSIAGIPGIWAKENKGAAGWTEITGTLGLYTDDDGNEYEQSSEGWAKARIRVLDAADIGSWTIKGYVKDKDGYKSSLYSETVTVYQADITGTISGTVTDKDTGNSIEGATVTANGYSDPDGTDTYGDYTIPNVPVGTSYTVTASKAGYQSQSQSNIEVLEDQTTTVNFQLTQLLISNLNRYTAKSDFDNGVALYSDREYTVSSVPEGYQGLDWIQTQCDDKQSTGSDWLTFDVSEDVTVYVGYAESLIEDGHSEAPWLDDGTWTDTGEGFEIVDWEPMRFYAKTFKKGGVILGGNYGNEDTPMYIVLVARGKPSTCGDVNCDGKVTMSDVRDVLNRYRDPSYPLDLPWAADVNCDGEVTMSDVRKVFSRYLDPGYDLNCCARARSRVMGGYEKISGYMPFTICEIVLSFSYPLTSSFDTVIA